jgi:putative restriction endonuclease
VRLAWDRQCALCGYDGQLAGATAVIDAAHVRWFTFDGPDDLDNGLALCVLHHKLFDLGVLGLDLSLQVLVSGIFTARTPAGRADYELHRRPLTPPARHYHPGGPAHHLAFERSLQRKAAGRLNSSRNVVWAIPVRTATKSLPQ